MNLMRSKRTEHHINLWWCELFMDTIQNFKEPLSSPNWATASKQKRALLSLSNSVHPEELWIPWHADCGCSGWQPVSHLKKAQCSVNWYITPNSGIVSWRSNYNLISSNKISKYLSTQLCLGFPLQASINRVGFHGNHWLHPPLQNKNQ